MAEIPSRLKTASAKVAWRPYISPKTSSTSGRWRIKVLKPELAAALGAERFVQEITTTANLQHPYILPLFDSGQAVVPPLRDTERGTGGEVFLYYERPFRMRSKQRL